ncbi:MAG TPA: sugar phosphate isomerase/epimerase [Chryseosolibacter sp.]|nr:sugar phosphate isomerase/epimerase [Chryseosolibacter sp.]
MDQLNRRKFISRGVTGLAGASMLIPQLLQGKNLSAKKKQIGFQSWIVKDDIGKDFSGTLKKMSALGFNSIEMCSPPGYSRFGFGALQHLSAKDLKKQINDGGFTCVSCHYGFSELKDHGQERIDFAKELGLTQMVIASYGLPKTATLDDWKRSADETNKLAELTRKSGVQLVFHNHNGELEKLDGQVIYDVLLDRLDPALVKMQFQLWVIIMGVKAADYFKKHPGRFISAHLYDWTGKGEEMAPLGKGVVDWNEFFAAAKVGGVKNYYAEMDVPYLKESAQFLAGRKENI